jgi:hypothetical protein
MSQVEIPLTITRPAAADLSASLYHFVELDSSGNVAINNTLGELSIGVLNNKPTALGQAAEVQVEGVAKVVAGATITPNQKVATSATGAAVVAISTYHVMGVCVKGGATGEVIEVLLGCAPILA